MLIQQFDQRMSEMSGIVKNLQNQPPRGVPRKWCSENTQQICRITTTSKCDFSKVALQLYWNRTSAWMFFCKFAAYFLTASLKNTSCRAVSEFRKFRESIMNLSGLFQQFLVCQDNARNSQIHSSFLCLKNKFLCLRWLVYSSLWKSKWLILEISIDCSCLRFLS